MVKVKNAFNYIFYLVISLFATYGIESVYSLGQNQVEQSNKFINIIVFFMILYIYVKSDFSNKRKKIFSIILASILGLIIIAGGQLEYDSQILWNILTIFKILGVSISIFPFFYKILIFLEKQQKNDYEKKCIKRLSLKTFLILFGGNFLVFLAIYPGVFGYDAGYQIMEFFNENVQLTSHFSIFYSAILSGLVYIGDVLFNSYQVGFAMYSLLQMAFLSFVSSRICLFCYDRLKNKYILYVIILFFSFYPLYTVMTLSSCQDAIFGGFFALILLNLIKLVENENYYNKKINIFSLVIEIFFLCISKNNGIYCVILVLLAIILLKKQDKLKTICVVVFPIILFKIFTGPIYDYIDVYKKPSIQEMSSVPSQQFARVYTYNRQIYTENELELLNKFYDLESFKYYEVNPSISDLMKASLNVEYTKNNIVDYLVLWAKIGIKDPENYIEAFLLNNLGLWYPNKNYHDSRMYHPYIEYEMLDSKKYNENYIVIERNTKFQLYNMVLEKLLVENRWQKLPVISTLFSIGTYFIIFIFFMLYTMYKKNYKLFIPISAIIGMYVTLLLSPVALFRYSFPILMVVPVMLSLILKNDILDENEKIKKLEECHRK